MEKEKEKDRIVYDALNTYYGMKAKYDEGIEKERHRLMKLPELSWKEKRIQYKKYRPKCVNCNRSVGTLFSVKPDKDGNRFAVALCGDRVNPCPLHIKINLCEIHTLFDDIEEHQQEISQFKKEIVVGKNDLLFGYITSKEAVEKFDRIKEDLNSSTSIYEMILQIFMNIIDNKERKEATEKLQKEVYSNIENCKQMVSLFDKTDNLQIINDVVGKYKDEMIPRLNELMNYKYAYSAVEYEDDKFHLVQKKFDMEDFEEEYCKDTRAIITMQTGMKREKKTIVKKPKFAVVKPDSESDSEEEQVSDSESGSDSEMGDDIIKLKISSEETPVKIDMDFEKEAEKEF